MIYPSIEKLIWIGTRKRGKMWEGREIRITPDLT